MSFLQEILISPLADYAFMRRALAACLSLSLGAGPIGVFLILRRMSLMGDAISHGILPGVAVGFLVSGLSLWAMSLGGLAAALTVALLSGVVSRVTTLREDASLAGFYLMSLALGVMLISLKGSSVDLLHILFGTLLAVDQNALYLVAGTATVSTLALSLIYRPLVVECFDPAYLRAVSGAGAIVHLIFVTLVVINLVAGMQALGTLLSIGLMMLPAAAARLWLRSVGAMIALATGFAMLSSVMGLLMSYHLDLPSGPTIVLTAGLIYVGSILLGRRGGVLPRLWPAPHLEH